MVKLEPHRAWTLHHRKTQRNAGSVGQLRPGWKIVGSAIETECFAGKCKRRIEILDGVDSIRKALDSGLDCSEGSVCANATKAAAIAAGTKEKASAILVGLRSSANADFNSNRGI